MTIHLNGITWDIPGDAKIEVSEDGKHVTITTMPEKVEKVRIVETPGPVQERIRVVEKIVEVEKPCTKQHVWPHYQPHTYLWGTGMTTTGTSSQIRNNA